MEFTGIVGDRGSGKTCHLVALMHDEWTKNKLEPISNIWLDFPHIRVTFEGLRRWIKEKNPILQGRFLGLDEISEWADAYDFFGKETQELTHFASQIRKLGMVCTWTDQRFNKVAKRLRDQTDKFMLMEDADKHMWEDPRIHRKHCEGRFRVLRIDEYFRIWGKPMIFNGREYWHLYNTLEEVTKGSVITEVPELQEYEDLEL